MIKQIKHLYIHIPFCHNICSYCDFVRFQVNDINKKEKYVNEIIKQIQSECNGCKFKTIYIGGGTPNCLDNHLLAQLLNELSKYLDNECEFTIECNPEFVNLEQIQIFKQYKINRISLGVQSLNQNVLNIFHRKHTNKQVFQSIKLLHKNNVHNISVDFIYGLNDISKSDLQANVQFLIDYQIPHVSFYSLELKPNSIMTKNNFHLNGETIDEQWKIIEKTMQEKHFDHYEIANFAINKQYYSQHNLAYWNTNDWIGIGLGAYGLVNRQYYSYVGNLNNYKKQIQNYDDYEYYLHILIMGLRLIHGFDLKLSHHRKAFQFFQHLIDPNLYQIIDEKIILKNYNQLDEILIKLVNENH
ncbi:coproporphyrinogen III oxidase [Candidatus Malacoplasma girerdii]|uniref:Heme chaperone HemW n=1 Tax=Candidatus Malacoplasma girerdii TaxID=1318617 RepID=A0A097SSD2_9BACT|nr:coproporphyrinogen III oxidase [Candidatus Malacoplasma girerdii]